MKNVKPSLQICHKKFGLSQNTNYLCINIIDILKSAGVILKRQRLVVVESFASYV